MKRRRIWDRFWEKVDQSGGEDACWPWRGVKNSWGYGYFWLNGSMRRAHRVAFALWHKRKINQGLYLLHTCDFRPCCNPRHLYEGTQSENVKDEWRRYRKPARELVVMMLDGAA